MDNRVILAANLAAKITRLSIFQPRTKSFILRFSNKCSLLMVS